MRKVIVVGQTPPPVGGQAAMIKTIVDAELDGVTKWHVELGAATSGADRGRFRIAKVVHVASVVIRIVWLRIRKRADTLYYPPSAELAPVCRDALILLAVRWVFPKTVWHFHAGGLGATLASAPKLLRPVLWAAFRKPSLAIRMSTDSPDDPAAVQAVTSRIIPYGLPDRNVADPADREPPPLILFAGVLRESKGVLVALDALGAVASRGLDFRAVFAGPWVSDSFRARALAAVSRLGLDGRVSFPGALHGDNYNAVFDQAYVFCFPTFFESESFSVVVIEAMRAAVPVVATRWRGLASMVRDSESGFLVEPHDPVSVAAKLEELLSQPAMAHAMGRHGRAIYEREYRLEQFLAGISDALRAA